MRFFYSKRGRQVFGPYESFHNAKEAAGVPASRWYDSRYPSAGIYVYTYRGFGPDVFVGERHAMLEAGHITSTQARIPALEREEAAKQNILLQSALADRDAARALLEEQLDLNAKLQAKNDELVRRLRAIRSTVEALG